MYQTSQYGSSTFTYTAAPVSDYRTKPAMFQSFADASCYRVASHGAEIPNYKPGML